MATPRSHRTLPGDGRKARSAAALAGGAGVAVALLLWPAPDNRLVAGAVQRSSAAPVADGRPAATAAATRHAQALLVQYQCTGCHRIAGVPGATGSRGPSLLHWGQRSYIAGQLPNTRQRLAQWIVDPAALLPDSAMPAMGVTPADAEAMAAYLHSQP